MLGTAAHHLVLRPVETLFIILTGLYLIAAALTASLPRELQRITHPAVDALKNQDEQELLQTLPLALVETQPVETDLSISMWKRLREDLSEGWQLVRQDGLLLDGLWQACFGGLIMLTIAELATTFVQRLLNLPTSDTALIFAPAGIGLVAGSLLVPSIVERLGSTRTIIVGMLGTALGIGLLPVAQNIASFSDPASWWTNPFFLLTIAGLTALAGLSLDLIVVPAQTRMQERSPDAIRGRVLALYQVLFNGGAIPVMLFMGALTDLWGIIAVIDMLVAFNLAAVLVTLLRTVGRGRSDAGSGPAKKSLTGPAQSLEPASIKQETNVSEPPAL